MYGSDSGVVCDDCLFFWNPEQAGHWICDTLGVHVLIPEYPGRIYVSHSPIFILIFMSYWNMDRIWHGARATE
jgi:hypothetical protein